MRYRNLDPRHARPSAGALLRWAVIDRITGRRRRAPPGDPAPSVSPDLALISENSGAPRLTWIGHASFLLQLGGANLLVDPVFSERIGWFYPRHGRPGLRADELPPIDLLLISHNHYDHLDTDSIAAVDRSATVIVPRGLGRMFVKMMFARVIELDWWDAIPLGEVEVSFVPARHWSKRTLFDTNRSLWGGFVVRRQTGGVYFAGDTAWFDGFAEIGRRFPGLEAAVVPIGGYEPAWFMENNHLNPEQAGQAFLDCGAKAMVPMHWGTFQMTDEPLCDPAERLQQWWDSAEIPEGRRLSVAAVGETLRLGNVRAST